MDSSYMTIDSNEEIKLIRETAKNFADKYIRPNLMEWDEAQFFPRDVFTKMGELGFMGVVIPEEYGGTGLNYQAYITIIEEISKVCGSVGLSLAAHNSLGTNHIYMFGSEEQKQKYLPKLASAEHLAFWGLTEANTGSDAMRMFCAKRWRLLCHQRYQKLDYTWY
jgi:acyl-CoA dehydrogenase